MKSVTWNRATKNGYLQGFYVVQFGGTWQTFRKHIQPPSSYSLNLDSCLLRFRFGSDNAIRTFVENVEFYRSIQGEPRG
jgi:hypothetical protein